MSEIKKVYVLFKRWEEKWFMSGVVLSSKDFIAEISSSVDMFSLDILKEGDWDKTSPILGIRLVDVGCISLAISSAIVVKKVLKELAISRGFSDNLLFTRSAETGDLILLLLSASLMIFQVF